MAAYAATETMYSQPYDASSQSPRDRDPTYDAGMENQNKSPLSSIPFYKAVHGEQKTRSDGQPHKRRGPKPDSKPALTRRQELNRQAQRERKELYIKALEQEVIRMKEVYSSIVNERDHAAEEVRILREILLKHNIPVPDLRYQLSRDSPAHHPSSSGSYSGSYAPASSHTEHSPAPVTASAHNGLSSIRPDAPQAHGIDYDQIGIDFVLTYASSKNPYLSPPHE